MPYLIVPVASWQVKIEFHREKVAKAVGSLARELGGGSRRHAGPSRRRQPYDVQGLLVNERFTKRLLAPSDLDEYTLVSVFYSLFVLACVVLLCALCRACCWC